MTQEKTFKPFALILTGNILMLINALTVAANWGPILLYSSPVKSLDMLMSDSSPFWMRIAFGVKGFVEGTWSLLWLILVGVLLYCTLTLYMKPILRTFLSPIIIILSSISIFYGGGFIIGMLLCIVGSAIIFEWPTPPKFTFLGRIVRAFKLEANLYQEIKGKKGLMKQAVYLILLVNILSGLGSGIYAFNVEKILNAQDGDAALKNLLLGEIFLDIPVLTPAFTYIGLAVMKWIILSLLIYIIGVKLAGGKAAFEDIAIGVSFAYAPISLQFFMPFIFTSKPHLSFTWPSIMLAITNLWMVIGLILATRVILELPSNKALGVVLIAGCIYLFMNLTLFEPINIPYSIRFFFEPEEVTLLVISCLTTFGVLLGTFSRQ